MYQMSESCVDVGSELYCNVTSIWQPRISYFGGIFAVFLPGTSSLLGLLYLNLYLKRRDGVKIVEETVSTYRRRVRLLYIKDYISSEEYETLDTDDARSYHVDPYTGYSVPRNVIDKGYTQNIQFNIDGDRVQLLDQLSRGSFNIGVFTCSDVESAKKDRRILCGHLLLPRLLGYLYVIVDILLKPIFLALWGVVDVFIDTLYFYQLERGTLLDASITRNSHVTNGIMVFAILGAASAVYVGYCQLVVIINNEDSKYHGKVVFWSTVPIGYKLIFEDTPELILEYFYVDKYVTGYSPWYLIVKDVLTALLYLYPVITTVSKRDKPYREVKKTYPKKTVIYVHLTISRLLFSLVMTFRVLGMIVQYTNSNVERGCFDVVNDRLIQTPFTLGCLNWCDWTILVIMSIFLINFFIPIVTTSVDMILEKRYTWGA